MFVCPACVGGPQFSNGHAFLAHFTFFHSKLIAAGSMVCAHSDCIGRKFSKINSYRKHVLSHKSFDNFTHTNAFNCNFDVENTTSNNQEHPVEMSPVESHNQNDSESSSESKKISDGIEASNSSVNFDEALTGSVIAYIANLYNRGNFTEAQIQFVVESHLQLLGGGFLTILKDTVQSLLGKAKDAKVVSIDEVNNVNRMFDSCQNMFEGFDTHYLRMKQVENSGAYVKPETFIIGHAQDVKITDGQAIIEPIELTGQFVPFRYVLKGFLELPSVLKDILAYVNYLETSCTETGSMESVIQGDLWRKSIKPKFQGKCVLPLIFNFDDFETNKELGTHTGIHKLGAGYIKIACLPPKFQSALENIFLSVLFHSGDRSLGNDKVFRKVIDELKLLENTGITVVTTDGYTQVYFALCLVTGDNLGANGILGFVESFKATFFCRICFEENSVTKIQTEANQAKKRTPETYLHDLSVDNEKLTGRKTECVFNKLDSFDVSENFHVDTMHDLDEGVWKYLMYFIVKYFFDKKRFTVDYLNEVIQGFYYGRNEEKNRPPTISQIDLVKSKRLRFSASEMRCFVRYFGLMFGHLVQEEDKHVWNLYLKARQIVDLVSAPHIFRSDASKLRNLIREHHSEYMQIFKTHLKPKFHLMIHEPDLIPMLGPLEPLSCYRTEHKHKEGKDIAHGSHNRINLPFTVAKRQQLRHAFRLLSRRGFHSKFEYSVTHSVNVQTLKDYLQFKQILPSEHISDWNTVKWLQVNGAKYAIGTVVLLSLKNDNSPVFGKICVISIPNESQANFLLRLLDVTDFDEHMYAYEVVLSNDWSFVNLDNLLTHVPTEVRNHENGKSYVSFRFSVACFR